ncbi:MAG: NADP-dependent oxidoreductase [Patescibacteria group bacterium]|jgi:NADPH:quinone reductase-like Zn-dependent oxidoreductase
MKAVQINKYGGPEVLEVNLNAPEPTLNPGQVLVEAHASSINPFDNIVLAGFMQKMMPLKFPAVMGGDFSGIVTKVADDVLDFKISDQVYGQAIVFNGGSGSFAQLVVSNTKNIALKPKNINFLKAASLPLVGSSAIQTLEDSIKLKTGQKILIHGAAGGIGSIAVQIAKSIGAYVAVTVSEKDKDFVKQLGADEIIDFKNQKFEEILKDYDAVYDTIGGEVADKSFLVLKRGGVIASMKGQPNEELTKQYQVTGIAINTMTNSQHLQRLAKLVEDGIVKPHVDRIFDLDQIKEAFIYKNYSHPRGKIVIKIKD